jgi:hypothetical protein
VTWQHQATPPVSSVEPPRGAPLPELDQTRRTIGFVLWASGCLIGLVLILVVFIVPELGEPGFDEAIDVWGRSAALAYLPVGLYLFVPYVVDRYDPEPWWALAGVFLWGALFAAGTSAFTNTLVSDTRFLEKLGRAAALERMGVAAQQCGVE